DMVSRVQVRIQDAGWLKRKLYDMALKAGYKRADALFAKKPLGFWVRISYKFWDWLVLSAVRDHLGLSRLRRAYNGGAALGPDVTRFFHAIGVNLKQIYGQTEVAGIAVVHPDGDIKFDTVGVPIPGTEVKISDRKSTRLNSSH